MYLLYWFQCAIILMFPSSTPRGATSLVPVLLFRDRLRSWVELIPIQQFGLGWPQQLVSSVWLKYYSDTTAYSDTIKLSVMWISVNTSNSTDLDLDFFLKYWVSPCWLTSLYALLWKFCEASLDFLRAHSFQSLAISRHDDVELFH